jgi:hypothetical protein
MHKIFYASITLLPMKALAGESCGSKIGALNSLAAEFLIPDFSRLKQTS